MGTATRRGKGRSRQWIAVVGNLFGGVFFKGQFSSWTKAERLALPIASLLRQCWVTVYSPRFESSPYDLGRESAPEMHIFRTPAEPFLLFTLRAGGLLSSTWGAWTWIIRKGIANSTRVGKLFVWFLEEIRSNPLITCTAWQSLWYSCSYITPVLFNVKKSYAWDWCSGYFPHQQF